MVSATAGSRTLTYQYNNSGNRTRIAWPDGFYVSYGYDLANRMASVYENGGPLLASYGYDTLSRRTSFGRNGDSTVYSYEPDSDLSSIVHGGAPGEPSFAFAPFWPPLNRRARPSGRLAFLAQARARGRACLGLAPSEPCIGSSRRR